MKKLAFIASLGLMISLAYGFDVKNGPTSSKQTIVSSQDGCLEVDSPLLHVDCSGDKVGIGTASPASNLEIADSAGPWIILQDSDGNRGRLEQQGNDLYISGTSGTGAIIFGNNGTGGTRPYSGQDEKMRIADGGVGIGTASPSTKLDVVGGSVRVDTATLVGNPAFYVSATQGNVGQGTTNPASAQSFTPIYEIAGTSPGFLLSDTGQDGFMMAANANTIIFINDTNGNVPLTLHEDAPTNSLLVASDGNVGIGTASPGEKLDVAGGIGHYSRTIAQLRLIAPSRAGVTYYCSDCTIAGGQIVYSTGTSAGNFADADGSDWE
jgi:hypothetical protein